MITAKVIADSISASGKRITTIQLEFPRFILSQFNKHRVFSNNAASSRAIPTIKLMKRVEESPVIPVKFGKNQPGMVAGDSLEGIEYHAAVGIWLDARNAALRAAQEFVDLGVHKEVVNRLLEPFSYTQVIVTATEWDNFFNLRLKPDAQPEIFELASAMKEAMEASTPKATSIHLPYVTEAELEQKSDMQKLSMISAARCARVSYNNHDGTEPNVVKDLELAKRLLDARHSVCFEHQATEITQGKVYTDNIVYAPNGEVRSCDFIRISPSEVSSNNFKGWKQFRESLKI